MSQMKIIHFFLISRHFLNNSHFRKTQRYNETKKKFKKRRQKHWTLDNKRNEILG